MVLGTSGLVVYTELLKEVFVVIFFDTGEVATIMVFESFKMRQIGSKRVLKD
jgi:hypothetical protein